MKRTVALLLSCVILSLLLAGCDPTFPETTHFPKSELESNIVKVELVHYENSDHKSFKHFEADHFKQLKPFDESNETIKIELPSDRIPDFLDQLSETDIVPGCCFFNSPKCLCLKLTYDDGCFMILNWHTRSFTCISVSLTASTGMNH